MPEVGVIINAVQFWLSDFLGRFERFLSDSFNSTINWLNDATFVILQRVNGLVASIEVTLTNIAQSVSATIQGFVQVMQAAVDRLWSLVTTATVKVLDTITAYVTNLASQVTSFVTNAIDKIRLFAEQIAQGVINLINRAIVGVQTLLTSAAQSIGNLVERQIELSERLGETLTKKLREGIDGLLRGTDSLIEGIGEKLGDIREGFAEAAADLVQGLSGISEETFNPLRDTLKDFFTDLVENAAPDETQSITAFFAERVKSGDPQQLAEIGLTGWSRFAPFKSKIWSGVFFFLVSILSLFPMLVSVTSAQSEVLLQGFRQQFPFQLLGPADATGAWRRGLIGESEAIDTIQKQGFTSEQAGQILKLSSIVPEGQELLTLVNRDFVSVETAEAALFERGLKDEFINPFLQLRNVLPPIQDLITMAVREVFTPDVVARFGQKQDFPERFAEEAKRQGLSRDWAENYWAAHWALPSPQQGFEMLHRGIIQEADLDLLLRALDVMPFWRDSLKGIAFVPFTRVDIRRMHRLGVLSDDDVERSYLDIGYSPEKAAIQKEFVIRLNKGKGAEDDAELGKLSRANVLGFFTDGLLTKERTQGLLEGLGHTPEAATLYIDAAELDEERKERKLEVTLAIDLAKAGTITFEEAQDRLNKIGMTDLEVKKAINKLLKAEEAKTKLPTRSEAEAMVRGGTLGVNDYNELLSRLGYAPKWRTAFVNLLGRKILASQETE